MERLGESERELLEKIRELVWSKPSNVKVITASWEGIWAHGYAVRRGVFFIICHDRADAETSRNFYEVQLSNIIRWEMV